MHSTAAPRTWGAAYHIPPEHVKEVREYLDIREIFGYSMDMVAFHVPARAFDRSTSNSLPSHTSTSARNAAEAPNPSSTEQEAPAPIQCLVYIATPDNPHFVGPQDPDELARHIVQSKGPSGLNKEYVCMLADGLDGLSKEAGVEGDVDDHVQDLARRVKKIDQAVTNGH